MDKPVGRIVAFDVDLAAGVLVRQQAGTDPEALQVALDEVGLRGLIEDKQEWLWLCQWEASVPAAKRASDLRALKCNDAVASVAPVLRDRLGQLRIPYPDRLDAKLVDGADEADWDRLSATHNLETVEALFSELQSSPGDGASPRSGATYLPRIFRAPAEEAVVWFVEPTYMVI